jgi:hypothetical protein
LFPEIASSAIYPGLRDAEDLDELHGFDRRAGSNRSAGLNAHRPGRPARGLFGLEYDDGQADLVDWTKEVPTNKSWRLLHSWNDLLAENGVLRIGQCLSGHFGVYDYCVHDLIPSNEPAASPRLV